MNMLAKKEDGPARSERISAVRPVYLETLNMVERLHRRLLDVIKDESAPTLMRCRRCCFTTSATRN
jgi:hypothetical protein